MSTHYLMYVFEMYLNRTYIYVNTYCTVNNYDNYYNSMRKLITTNLKKYEH